MLAYSWEVTTLFDNDALLQAAQVWHDLLLPPAHIAVGAQPPALGVTEQQVRGWAQEEMDRWRSLDSDRKGCRRMKEM